MRRCWNSPWRNLRLGRVTCDYFDNGVQLGSTTNAFTRVKKLPVRRVAIDDHGRCLVDGKPFFPLGLYGSRFTSREIGEDLSRAGFNCYMPYGNTQMEDLDLAAEYGIRLFADVAAKIPVMLSADAAPQVSGAPESLLARTWVKDGEAWLLLCNITRQPIKTTVTVGGRNVPVDLPSIGVSFERLPR